VKKKRKRKKIPKLRKSTTKKKFGKTGTLPKVHRVPSIKDDDFRGKSQFVRRPQKQALPTGKDFMHQEEGAPVCGWDEEFFSESSNEEPQRDFAHLTHSVLPVQGSSDTALLRTLTARLTESREQNRKKVLYRQGTSKLEELDRKKEAIREAEFIS